MLNLPALNLNRSFKHRNMKRTILNIMLMLLAATAVLSCSKGDFDVALDSASPSSERSILITGSATDSQTGTGIENIMISFKAYQYEDSGDTPLISEDIYTNSNGIFTLHTDGTDQPLFCILTASDAEGIYETQTKQVIVTWSGTSFDRHNNMFVVNDCTFIMTKAQ